jgi:hypothetical protein
MDINAWKQDNLARIKPSDKSPYVAIRDEQIKLIAKKFDVYVAKYTKQMRKTLPEENIKESINYKYYVEVAEIFQSMPYISHDRYLEAQAYFAYKQGSKYCNPSWLNTEKGFQRYMDFMKMKSDIESHVKEDISYHTLDALKNSILFVEEKQKELKLSNIKEVLNYRKPNASAPSSYVWILNGSINRPFLSISKSYTQFYNELEPDIKQEYPEPESLAKVRMIIMLNQKLRKFCEVVIPQEINFKT